MIGRVTKTLCVALALAVVLVPARAKAWAPNTWYVDNTSGQCSDTGLGSREKPYCSISAALAAHRDSGVTIVVHGGPYRERISIGSNGSASGPIVVRTDGTPVVIDGADDYSQPDAWQQASGDVWLAASVSWTPVVRA